jgi:hypothetical protein
MNGGFEMERISLRYVEELEYLVQSKKVKKCSGSKKFGDKRNLK